VASAVRDYTLWSMPSLPRPPDGSLRLALSGAFGNGEWANVLWIQGTDATAASQADLDSLVDAVAAAYHTRFMPYLCPQLSLGQGKAQMFLPLEAELVSLRTFSYTGSLAGSTAAPASAAAVVSWSINDYYRGGHPRTYLCGLSTTELTGENALTGTAVANLKSAASSFLTDVNALTYTSIPGVTLGTLRRYEGHVVLDPPQFKPYIGTNVHQRIGTQRRRLGAYLP